MTATDAMISAGFGAIGVFAGEGWLGAFLAADVELFGRQFFAPVVFVVLASHLSILGLLTVEVNHTVKCEEYW